MKKLVSSYTCLSFPHYTRLAPTSTDKRAINLKDYHGFGGQNKMVNIPAMVRGDVLLIEDPRDPVIVGDEVYWNNDHSYKVTAIVEQRPARGDWSFVNGAFIPEFKRISVSRC